MTEKEFKELKVGDEVNAFVFSQKRTAMIESIVRDTGRCTARILNPLVLEECRDYYGTIFRLEPATKIAIIEADYSKLGIVREENQ